MFDREIEKCHEKIAVVNVGAGTIARINSDDDSVTLKEARTSALKILDDLVHISGSEDVGVVITTPKHIVSCRGHKVEELAKEWKVKL